MRLPDLIQLLLQPQIALDIKHILHKYNKPHGLQHCNIRCAMLDRMQAVVSQQFWEAFNVAN